MFEHDSSRQSINPLTPRFTALISERRARRGRRPGSRLVKGGGAGWTPPQQLPGLLGRSLPFRWSWGGRGPALFYPRTRILLTQARCPAGPKGPGRSVPPRPVSCTCPGAAEHQRLRPGSTWKGIPPPAHLLCALPGLPGAASVPEGARPSTRKHRTPENDRKRSGGPEFWPSSLLARMEQKPKPSVGVGGCGAKGGGRKWPGATDPGGSVGSDRAELLPMPGAPAAGDLPAGRGHLCLVRQPVTASPGAAAAASSAG